MTDQAFNRQKFRVLTIVDHFSRESLAITVDFASKTADMLMSTNDLKPLRCSPKCISLNRGSGSISHALDHWAYENGVPLNFRRPGNRRDNSFIESFNDRFREKYLNMHWLLSIDDAGKKIES